ncbi:arginine metabolism regulation protein II [Elasticomyces elasticus]|nr:arginine metabolism regulation protein II [Elasticomyces elasticus]KAK3630773.1 arginine metabolism regulation protein II [Elasticomyces elasticus]KAK4909187.1 arginine metabolism regulation protein II [Elasticomyces elasticus]KAK5749282.1 arginine metabolism regulation protein II [Elasticomyces elasticus]
MAPRDSPVRDNEGPSLPATTTTQSVLAPASSQNAAQPTGIDVSFVTHDSPTLINNVDFSDLFDSGYHEHEIAAPELNLYESMSRREESGVLAPLTPLFEQDDSARSGTPLELVSPQDFVFDDGLPWDINPVGAWSMTDQQEGTSTTAGNDMGVMSANDAPSCANDAAGQSNLPLPIARPPASVIPHTPSPRRHLDLLLVPSRQLKYVHHWVTTLCDRVSSIPTANNLFKNLFTRLALEGCNLATDQSDGRVAMFHALCAASAFHLDAICGGTSDDLEAAYKHHRLSIVHISTNIGKAAHSQDISVLASLYMSLVAEAITGRVGAWRGYVHAMQTWLVGFRASKALKSEIEVAIDEFIQASEVLRQSHLPGQDMSQAFDPAAISGMDTLTSTYGIAILTLRNISKTRRMVCAPNSYTAEDIDRFEIELLLSIPPETRFPGVSIRGQEQIQKHGMVFYYAVQIYFKRAVRKEVVDDVQSLVERGFEHLEALDDNIALNGAFVVGHPVIWPVLVIAMEADSQELQERAIKWFETRELLGFKIWHRVWESIQDIWRMRAERRGRGTDDYQAVLQRLHTRDITLL